MQFVDGRGFDEVQMVSKNLTALTHELYAIF